MTQKQTLATTFHASQKTLNQTQPLSERHLHPKVAGRLPSAAPTMTASETTLKLKQPQRTANKTGTRLNVEKPSLTASLTAWQLHQLQGEFMIEPFCPLGRKEQLARRYHIKDADVIKVSAHCAHILSVEHHGVPCFRSCSKPIDGQENIVWRARRHTPRPPEARSYAPCRTEARHHVPCLKEA